MESHKRKEGALLIGRWASLVKQTRAGASNLIGPNPCSITAQSLENSDILCNTQQLPGNSSSTTIEICPYVPERWMSNIKLVGGYTLIWGEAHVV